MKRQRRPLGVAVPVASLELRLPWVAQFLITVHDQTGHEVSQLRRRAAFLPDRQEEGYFYNASFFVVLDERCPSGAPLTAHAVLEDRSGNMRCGALEFVADCGGT
jgi:hypothetical protein